jgi:hypothetical protein
MEFKASKTAVVNIDDLAGDLSVFLRTQLIGELHNLLDTGDNRLFRRYTGIFEKDYYGYKHMNEIICGWCELLSEQFFVKNPDIDDVLVEYGESNKLIQRSWVANRNYRKEKKEERVSDKSTQ